MTSGTQLASSPEPKKGSVIPIAVGASIGALALIGVIIAVILIRKRKPKSKETLEENEGAIPLENKESKEVKEVEKKEVKEKKGKGSERKERKERKEIQGSAGTTT